MDTDKIIFEGKLEALESAGPKVEYLVDGSSVGDEGMVPCVLESESGDNCSVTIADGPYTGTSVTVNKRHVVALGAEFFEDAARKLFK